jgi:hypothetical protein
MIIPGEDDQAHVNFLSDTYWCETIAPVAARVVCVKLCKKGVMVSVADQAAIFKSSFFCSASSVMLR